MRRSGVRSSSSPPILVGLGHCRSGDHRLQPRSHSPGPPSDGLGLQSLPPARRERGDDPGRQPVSQCYSQLLGHVGIAGRGVVFLYRVRAIAAVKDVGIAASTADQGVGVAIAVMAFLPLESNC